MRKTSSSNVMRTPTGMKTIREQHDEDEPSSPISAYSITTPR